MKVEVAVQGSPSLIVIMTSLDVKLLEARKSEVVRGPDS